jgi:murein DD-endopeptidase MepM/ murein hydrolase activator NlpD
VGWRIPILGPIASILIALSLLVSVSATRASEGTLVAGTDFGASGVVDGPDSGTDPLRCVERVPIPTIENAIETSWSPDGTHLAFTRIVASSSRRTVTGYEEDPGIAILDLATGAVRTHGEGTLPQWSASGQYLSFWRKGHVFIIKAGRNIAILESSEPEVRWVGDQLVYFKNDDIRGWTEAADVVISTVSWQYMPRFPMDWTEFSADGQLFTLTRYSMDGRADRYVGETRTGQVAPLTTAGTTYTEWAPAGQTLLVRSDDQVELRGAGGFDAVAPVTKFPGTVHGWTPDGKSLLMGRVTSTVPAGPSFDRFAVWDGLAITTMATLPNLLGSRAFSPDGRFFAGVARSGLYETTLEVYRCGSRITLVPSRADPVSRARQQRIDSDTRRFVRPVIGYFSQFLQGAHTGIDIAAPFGSIITADDEGEVTYVGWRPVGGRAVCVLHGEGLESCAYHTSQALVRVGQRVARGEPIALIGMTGLTSGPHVHWEVKQGGLIVDPLKH